VLELTGEFVETPEIVKHAQDLIALTRSVGPSDSAKVRGISARASSFLATFGGQKNAFLAQLQNLSSYPEHNARILAEVLQSFIAHLEAGLVADISPKRQAELDVVSDFLEQAQHLLQSAKVHAAAPAVLIGATLEEFLRTWVEDAALSLGGKNPSLDSYTKVLREAELISKQDVKDITSWAGIRNHAAHGEWDELGDKQRVRLMLDGVNLFMRRYSGA
jgi:hypothetical protein